MPRTAGSWERPIPDVSDGSVLRLDRDGVHALIDEVIVSTPEAMDAASLIVALGGEPFDWYPTVMAARTTLTESGTDPHVSRSDVLRAIRILTRPVHIRTQAAEAPYDSTPVALWRQVALSMDPAVEVRRAMATADLRGHVGNLVLDHLLADSDPQVLQTLTQRRDALANSHLLVGLIEHTEPVVRREITYRLDARSAWLGVMLVDPDPTVVIAAKRVEAAGRYRGSLSTDDHPDWN